jgi:hypothetical protein
MSRLIVRYILLFVLIVTCSSVASAWQPNGWLYRSGNSQYSVNEDVWFWNQSSWNQWVVGMSAGTWQKTPVEGWCYYRWPYFWSNTQQQWYFTAEPGDQAWSVNLGSGEWSIYGDDDVVSISSGQLYMGRFFGVTSGLFLVVVEPDRNALVLALDEVYDELFAITTSVGTSGEFNFYIGDFYTTGSAQGQALSGSGTSVYGNITITGSLIEQGLTASLSGYYTGTGQDSEGSSQFRAIISPDGKVYFYENHSYWGEGLGVGTISSNGSYQVSDTWGDSYSGSAILNGSTLNVSSPDGTATLQRQFTFEAQ